MRPHPWDLCIHVSDLPRSTATRSKGIKCICWPYSPGSRCYYSEFSDADGYSLHPSRLLSSWGSWTESDSEVSLLQSLIPSLLTCLVHRVWWAGRVGRCHIHGIYSQLILKIYGSQIHGVLIYGIDIQEIHIGHVYGVENNGDQIQEANQRVSWILDQHFRGPHWLDPWLTDLRGSLPVNLYC